LNLARNPQYKIVCMGNSSSGIKETPVFSCPTVNIGTRQEGRLRAANVIDVDYDEKAIYAAVHKCLDDKEFRALCSQVKNPYGEGQAAKIVVDSLLKVDLGEKLITKKTIFRKS
jgi:UDP-N-acetylglucosamine 2-epimerase